MKKSFIANLLSALFISLIPFMSPHFCFAAQIQLVWDPVTEADLAGYIVYYGTDPGVYGTRIPIGKDPSFTLTGLTQGARYYINVAAIDIYEDESDLDPLNEVNGLAIEPPGTATLVSPSPSETITDTTPPYIWNAVPESSWYYLWVNDSTGTKIQKWYSAVEAGCPSGTGACSVTPATEVLGSSQWRIKSSNSAGYGPWSTDMSFTVRSSGQASLGSPSGTISDPTPTYTWNAVTGATWYQLYVNDAMGNRIKQWYPAADLGCPDGTGTCSITPTLDVVGSCQWWIQTYSRAGYGPWSTAGSFTAPSPQAPDAATPGSPSADTTTPTYTWNAVSGATWYQLYVNDAMGNRIKQWYPAADLGCPDGTGTCSITPTLDVVGSCQWWIQTYNRVGYGPWSIAGSFTAPNPEAPGAATPVSPSGTITDTTPTYTWNAVSNATWYRIWVNDSTGNKIQKWYAAADLGCPYGAGTCSVTPDTELALGPYQWWVRTYNSGGFGPWSGGKSFTIPIPSPPSATTQIWPSGTITDTTPPYIWNAVSGTTWYQLYVNDSAGNKIQKWFRASEVGCETGTGACSVKPTTTLAVGAGQWWVRTYNSGGFGPWSLQGRNFTVSPPG
jgi:hypothetical protein